MQTLHRLGVIIVTAAILLGLGLSEIRGEAAKQGEQEMVQAGAVLTVSESKRLIGKAVAEMPIVKQALKDGMVIIAKGTTNTYVAEELLGAKIEHGAFVSGRIYPQRGGKKATPTKRLSEIILIKGELAEGLSLAEAVKKLKPGDVVIKGANVLDYNNKMAGVLIGSPTGGTTGTIMPYVIARKAHLVIPVGLEKQAAGEVADIADKMREPVESLNNVPSVFPLRGHIVTEIEALKVLADVSAFQAAAGGIGGAEGSVWIIFRGTREKVKTAMALLESVQGEPPFVE